MDKRKMKGVKHVFIELHFGMWKIWLEFSFAPFKLN